MDLGRGEDTGVCFFAKGDENFAKGFLGKGSEVEVFYWKIVS